jgi:hypothetical protein
LEKICEENIQFYVDDSIRNGVSMANLFASEDHCSAIKDLFQELISALEGALGTDAGGESDNSENEESEAPLPKKETKPKTARYEMNEKSDADGDSFNEKLTLVTNYLLEIYVALDSKNLGTLPNDIFWSVFADLDIAKLVYTEEEIATMPDLSENISTDGNVYWADILAEMSEGILSGMVRNGISCRQFLDEQMATSGAKLKAALEEGQSILEYISGEIYNNDEDLYVAQSLSPDLLTYLEKTFHAFDKENKGFLSRDDFWFMLQLLNLGVAGTGSELDAVMESFDANADGHIEWKEALPKFDDIIHDMCSDEQDHWIGLEDPDSTPPCFWYNLLDGASQWMSEEEAENYKSHKDTGVQLAGPDTKSMTCSNIGIVTHIMHLKKMLASKKSLRESVENDDNMDPDQKSAALQKIDIDYTETIKTLRMQQETALKQLDQRLGQDRGDKKKKLQIRLEEKKKKKKKATM